MFRSRTACVCDSVGMAQSVDPALRYTVKLVALLNLGYIDFLEDATVNGLILVALGWNARRRGPARRAA
jgi:hypothetical protein